MWTNVGACNFFFFFNSSLNLFDQISSNNDIISLFLVSWGNSNSEVLGTHKVSPFPIHLKYCDLQYLDKNETLKKKKKTAFRSNWEYMMGLRIKKHFC